MGILKVKVGDRWVGDSEPCFVVAEAGANHNRDLAMGKELIDLAAEAGADAVKFQTYSAETLYSKKTPKFSYLEKQTSTIAPWTSWMLSACRPSRSPLSRSWTFR